MGEVVGGHWSTRVFGSLSGSSQLADCIGKTRTAYEDKVAIKRDIKVTWCELHSQFNPRKDRRHSRLEFPSAIG